MIDTTLVPEIKIVVSPQNLVRDASTTLKIILKIPENFHIQAYKPAEELLIPTRITFDEAEDIILGEPIYPEPVKLTATWSEVTLLVYEGETVIQVPIQISEDASIGKHEIKGILSFQGCTATSCLPPQNKRFSLTMGVLGS